MNFKKSKKRNESFCNYFGVTQRFHFDNINNKSPDAIAVALETIRINPVLRLSFANDKSHLGSKSLFILLR